MSPVRGAAQVAGLLVAGLLAAAMTAGTAAAADPFYLGLLEDGDRDYRRGAYDAAAEKLRIACFGFLEEPELLAEGLVRLGLAQSAGGDEAAFAETFERLVEIERRFGAYGKLPASWALRRDFERHLATAVSRQELARAPVFAHLLDEAQEAALEAMPPARRRRELERRIRIDPGDGRALLALTRIDIARGDSQRAARRLAAILAADPDNRTARCARGQMDLREMSCDTAMADLALCRSPPRDEVLAPRYLRCLVDAGDWPAAARYVHGLPLAVQTTPDIAELAVAIPQDLLAAQRPDPTDETLPSAQAASSPAPGAPPAAVVDAASMLAGPTITPADRAELDRLRRSLDAATRAGDLDAPFAAAAALADRHPDWREAQYLAAEIAYRTARWSAAASYFRRGGQPGPDRPLLLFYMAVALYEDGDRGAAAEILRQALPRLERNGFVDGYVERILGS